MLYGQNVRAIALSAESNTIGGLVHPNTFPMELIMIRRTSVLLSLTIALALGTSAPPLAAQTASKPAQSATNESKATALDRLYGEYWEETLKLNPIQATFQGDPRYNDQLPNFLTEASRRESSEFNLRWLKKIEALGPDGLDGQDRLSYDIFIKGAKDTLEGEQFPNHLMPINQFNNLAGFAAQLGSGTNAQPFKTVKDYDNWRTRGSKFAPILDQAIVNMREGTAESFDAESVAAIRCTDRGSSRQDPVLGADQEHADYVLGG
jgi:uncharacterized protein (DUF885 family)